MKNTFGTECKTIHRKETPLKCFILPARSIMGPDLELVVLEMTVEDQMERVRTRARGSEQAVEILKVRF